MQLTATKTCSIYTFKQNIIFYQIHEGECKSDSGWVGVPVVIAVSVLPRPDREQSANDRTKKKTDRKSDSETLNASN